MSDVHDVLIGWVNKFQAALNALEKPLEWLIREWPNIEARRASIPAAAQESFKAAGFPPCRLLSFNDISEIERDFTTQGVQAAASTVERLCREVIASAEMRAEMLKDWAANPVTAPRIHILTAALEAHQECRYVLSIPPLLAQLEGIIADGKQPQGGRMGQKTMAEYVAQLAEGDDLMGAHISDFVSDIVLADFIRG